MKDFINIFYFRIINVSSYPVHI